MVFELKHLAVRCTVQRIVQQHTAPILWVLRETPCGSTLKTGISIPVKLSKFKKVRNISTSKLNL
jgi:hypothetical protein